MPIERFILKTVSLFSAAAVGWKLMLIMLYVTLAFKRFKGTVLGLEERNNFNSLAPRYKNCLAVLIWFYVQFIKKTLVAHQINKSILLATFPLKSFNKIKQLEKPRISFFFPLVKTTCATTRRLDLCSTSRLQISKWRIPIVQWTYWKQYADQRHRVKILNFLCNRVIVIATIVKRFNSIQICILIIWF